jgi:hypothetical protein
VRFHSFNAATNQDNSSSRLSIARLKTRFVDLSFTETKTWPIRALASQCVGDEGSSASAPGGWIPAGTDAFDAGSCSFHAACAALKSGKILKN